ncbi:hypothetical protein ACSSV5_002248 [Psychroflexus sp. MBR-150]|jgi:hypothetical protein
MRIIRLLYKEKNIYKKPLKLRMNVLKFIPMTYREEIEIIENG